MRQIEFVSNLLAAHQKTARTALLSPAAVWVFLFIVLPLGVVFRYSLAERGTYGGVVPTWVWSNYALSLSAPYPSIYWRSIWIALLTTALCLALAWPVAYHIAVKADRRWKNVLLVLTVIPFWTSFLIRTYAWILILRAEGVVNTWLTAAGVTSEPLPLLYSDFAVLVGLVYAELPFMILPLYASLEKLDLRLLEASADLGAAPLTTFRRVTLPLSKAGILTGSVLVFIPSLGCFVTSDLLGGAKTILVGNLIQNQFVQRNQPFGSAVAMLLTVTVLVLLATAMRAGMKVDEKA